MDKMKIYNNLPIWLQNLACSFEGLRIKRTRYGKIFWESLAEYESHNNWSYNQLCDYRDARLRKMIRHCYDTVPYYTKLFSEGGINPESIRTIEDLSVLPILTKDTVKENYQSFISKKYSEDETKIHPTGGTTGAGLKFVTSDGEEAKQWAVWWRYRRWLGIDFDTWCGNFGGKTVVSLNQSKQPFWRINKPGKQVFYSGYHINRDNAKYYAEHISVNNISWIHGYPSNLSEFASYLHEQGITLPLKWVTIGAENLYPQQAEMMEKVFKCKPAQHYGLTEGVANISQRNGELTVDEDFSCVEFTPSDNNDEFHIIGTTLTNYAMPLLRYNTGDLAIIKQVGKHNQSGRTVDSLNGRENEYVLLPNGVKVGTAAISLIVNRFQGISQSQIVQHSKDNIDFFIIKSNLTDIPEDQLLNAFKERLGADMNVAIKYTDSLIKTKSGKQKLIISEIK